ncbi:hypothetical protein [Salinimicrobium sp. WS361]|uniref:hypothetical protein n=1 Tax=Salinimicrobium sp. WS361 TaxID=3425123 RepID=UPI003D6EEF27
MKILDSFLKYIPLASIFIVFLSAIRQFIFYSNFNIDILSYLTLTEFLTLFLKDGIVIAFTVILAVPTVYILKNQKKVQKLAKKNLRLWQVFIILITLILIVAAFFVNLFFELKEIYNKPQNHIEGLNIIASFLLVGIALSILFLLSVKKISTIKQVVGTGSLITVFVIIFSSLTAYNTKNKERKNIHLIITDKEMIRTDDSLIYLGKTESYFFLYNKTKNSARIIKSEIVKQLEVIEK